MKKNKDVTSKLPYTAVYYSRNEDRLIIAPDLKLLAKEANEKDNKEALIIARLLYYYDAVHIGEL